MADPTNPELDPEQSQAARVHAALSFISDSPPTEEEITDEAVMERRSYHPLRKAGSPVRDAEQHAEDAASTAAAEDIASSKWHALQAEKAAVEVEAYAVKLQDLAKSNAEKMQGLIDQADAAAKTAREHAGMRVEQKKSKFRSWLGFRRT